MNDLILTVVAIIVVTVGFSIASQRQKKSSWVGKLIKKKEHYNDESGITTYYLIFSTDKGKKKVNLSSPKAEYDKWSVGDNAVKKSGSYLPERE